VRAGAPRVLRAAAHSDAAVLVQAAEFFELCWLTTDSTPALRPLSNAVPVVSLRARHHALLPCSLAKNGCIAALLAARCSGQRGRHPRAVCAGGACPEFGGDCVSVSAPARAHAYECTWQVVLAAAAPGCAVRLRARGRACNTRRWRCGVWRGTAAAVTHHGTETAPPRRQQLNLRGPASPAAFCDVYAGLPNREGGRWEAAPPALRAARAAERCAQMSRWLFRHTARRRTGARTARRRARRALRARCRPRPRAAAAAARRARRCQQPRPSAFDRAADAHASNSFHLQRRLSAPVETRQEAAPRASAHGAAAA